MKNITELFDLVSSTKWSFLISSLFAIISIVLAIIFFIKGRKFKNPRYSIRSNSLIKNFTQQINGLNISYNNQPISSVTVSKIAFWNKGKETLNYSDFAEADPFEICSNSEILSASIIFSRNKTNSVSCKISDDKKSIKILFDFFDKNDGFIVQIIHTGETEKCFSIKGTVKGVGPLLKRKINFEPFYVRIIEKMTKRKSKGKKKYLNISLKIFGWIIVLLSIFLLMSIIYAMFNGSIKKEDFIPLIFAFVIYLVMGIDVIRPKIPREFKDFYEIIE